MSFFFFSPISFLSVERKQKTSHIEKVEQFTRSSLHNNDLVEKRVYWWGSWQGSSSVVEWSPRRSTTKDEGRKTAANSTISSRTGLAVDRAVDRPHKQVIGLPARSTDVHNVHKERARSTARSTDWKYPTLWLSVGHPVDRPVDRWKGSVDRPVDQQSGEDNFLLIRKSVYLRAVVGF